MAPLPTAIGRYHVERVIGHGGMATLYLATDPKLERKVAIKVLREPDSDELRERFEAEARTVARLSHRNIVGIYDTGQFDGGLFIAMEYLAGETLAEVIRRRAPLSLRRKLEIVLELCEGLDYAHRAGVIHRDVKPANVMVDEQGTVKLLDWGIARMSVSSVTQTGMLVGSLSYIAPEQVDGRPVDARSDIFCAGIVLYELLGWRQAFAAKEIAGVLAQIMNGGQAPLLSIVPGLAPEVVAIVDRAMARNPDERYQTIAEMGRDLERARMILPRNEQPHVPPDAAAAAGAAGSLTGSIPADSFVAGDATVVRPRPARAVGVSEAPPDPALAAGQTVILSPGTAAALRGDDMPEVQVLVVRSGDTRRRGHTVRLGQARFTVGRGAHCDLQLDDQTLSREHVAIEYGPAGFVVRDVASANGTFLNGRRLKSGTAEGLYFGASIELGDTVLAFTLAFDVKLPDLTGSRLAGRYELVRLIRDSAKGSVYAGRDTKVAKDVAIKLMSPELMRLEGYREQFEREAAIGATLHHPHICQVLDRGEDDVRPLSGPVLRLRYLCVELMAGGSLQHRIHAGALPLDQVAGCIERVADALDYAHRHGVVHGDVKPSAIVFSDDGHVYLTDFAFAQRALQAGDGPALGTPAYVAPEVWDHGQITPATDQFALAVVAYYALAGSLPFAGQESPAVRRKNFALGAVPAHQEAASYRQDPLARPVSDVLARALSQDPERRFPSTREFSAALSAALKGRRADRGAPHVFLSYQRDMSSGWANYFAKELKDHGIATFLDVQQIDRAQQFPARLSRAIEECDVFVCLLGATTLHSAWVLEEIRQAHRHGKPMIPIFQESFEPAAAKISGEVALEALLTYDAVHLFDLRNVHIEHSASDLAALVKNTVARL